MKNWSGQLFPITLLALLAGLSFWLQAILTTDEVRPGKRLATHEADAIVENFEVRRLDEQGKLQYRLSAPQLRHFPEDDSSLITSPRLLAYRDDAPPLILTAGQAKVTARGETITLDDSVEITRAATEKRPELNARTSTLTVEPETGKAHTDQAMTITLGASEISGVGARIDNKASTFELRSQVRGRYLSARAKP
ncbi:LPS export ABC transporter periplasmic protein LptC [Azonexus caeni]|uniref:LPS export ABC transporter periplasmic protein LptC n=1 Tax=Azonexus caeni TaxID=266126 RepID=UPI003A871909